jgi:hypothetical protein
MKRAKHTPLPWRRDGTQMCFPGGREVAFVIGGRSGAHATIFIESIVKTKKEREQFEANIDLTLRAVNISVKRTWARSRER